MPKNNQRFVVDSLFIKQVIKNKLNLNEFLLLLFFDNAYTPIFDIKLIKEYTDLDEMAIVNAYSTLLKKNLIKIKPIKNNEGKIIEQVILDNFYEELVIENKVIQKEIDKSNIYELFEKSFGNTLSPMDFEIINAWINRGFSEKLIIAALNEAKKNNVASLRYVDKILYEWNRKGIKDVKDISNYNCKESSSNCSKIENELLDFNWIDEE